MQPVTLRTGRLVLSEPDDGDVDAIYRACQDPDIQRYTTVPSPYTRADAEGFVASSRTRWSDGVEATWVMRDAGGLAGMIGIHHLTAGGAGELGYWVAPASRGRGLLTESAHAVLDWGFSAGGPALERIEWRAVVGNVASARFARAVGFRYEGRLRGAHGNSLGRYDAWIAAALRADDRIPHPWPVLQD